MKSADISRSWNKHVCFQLYRVVTLYYCTMLWPAAFFATTFRETRVAMAGKVVAEFLAKGSKDDATWHDFLLKLYQRDGVNALCIDLIFLISLVDVLYKLYLAICLMFVLLLTDSQHNEYISFHGLIKVSIEIQNLTFYLHDFWSYPPKPKLHNGKSPFLKGHSSSNGWLSIVMLLLRGDSHIQNSPRESIPPKKRRFPRWNQKTPPASRVVTDLGETSKSKPRLCGVHFSLCHHVVGGYRCTYPLAPSQKEPIKVNSPSKWFRTLNHKYSER